MAKQNTQATIFDSLSPVSASHDVLRGVRILFLTDEVESVKAGGSERELLQMIDICKSGGMRPYVGVLRNSSWLTEEIAGCPVTRVPVNSAGLGSLLKLKQWLRDQQFDILQTMSRDADFLGPIAGHMAGIPVILSTRKGHGKNHADGPGNRPRRWQSRVNAFVHQFIANSNAALEEAVLIGKISRDRVRVAYSGIDLERTHPEPDLRAGARAALGIEDDQILVGNVSGLRPGNGVQLFINAAVEAYRQDPRLRFILLGNGDMKTQLRQTVHIYGMDGVFRLSGAADNLKPYLAAFDFGVVCSQAEGSACTLLDYMASAVPVLATDEYGSGELLGSCGVLVRPEVQDLVEGMRKMTDPELRSSFAEEALDRVKQFDLADTGRSLKNLYALQLANIPSKTLPKQRLIAPRAGATAEG